MKVAIIGGGINGVMSAWELAKRGADVHLFERDHLMRATSSASTKMLYGGIRYVGVSLYETLAIGSGFRAGTANGESVIERNNKLINVFGGKWTTSRALAKRIAKIALH